MEPSKFNTIVEDLLELRAKPTAQRSNQIPIEQRRSDGVVLRPKQKLRPCEDCGNLVANRVVYYYKHLGGRPPKYIERSDIWYKDCQGCDLKIRIR